jgi:hypothetical protein
MPSPNVNFDQILTTTLENRQATLVDVVFTARPLAYWLKDNIELKSGGTKIVTELMYGQNTTAGSYSGSDILNTAEQDGITAAEWEWKQYAVSITITGFDELRNNGEEAVIDLLEAKVEQAEQTIIEKMDEMFITSDGTGNSGKDWLGLKALVANSANTVGNINSSTYSWWANYHEGSAGALTVAAMGTAYNTVSEGNDQPGFILTTQTLYEKYESLLQPNIRYESTEMADAGFISLMFKKAPVMFDRYVPTGYMYFLNPRYLKLIGHRDRWFKPTKFKEPVNQDIRVAQIYLMGQMICTNRKRQGLLTGRTA